MTGTGGWVSYANEDFSLWFQVQWDNPYLGDNKAGARLGWAQADQYMVRYIVGSGNTGAAFRFILLPIPAQYMIRLRTSQQEVTCERRNAL